MKLPSLFWCTLGIIYIYILAHAAYVRTNVESPVTTLVEVEAATEPTYAHEPASIRVVCRVADPYSARGLTLAVQAEDAVIRRSFRDMGNITLRNELLIEGLGCGQYEAVCILMDRAAKTIVDHRSFRVLGTCDGTQNK